MPSKRTFAALGMIACGALLVRCGDDDEDEIKQPTEPSNRAAVAPGVGLFQGQPVAFNPTDLHRR